MIYHSLKKTDLKLSAIGFGCMSIEGSYKENEKLIHHAVDLGINFFDTADLYQHGENEQTVGKALKSKRHDVFIATKVGNQWNPDGKSWDWNPSKAYILEAVEKSLKRLQTDRIDLYQLHGGTINDPIDETIEAFEILKGQGKILHYGISSIRPNVIREYMERSSIVSVMMQYSLLDRRPEENCLESLKEKNIGVLTRGSLAKGLLAGKAPAEMLGYTDKEVASLQKAIQKLSHEDRTEAQTALHWVLSNKAVCSAVVGIRTEKQLLEIAETIKAPALTKAEKETLDQVLAPKTYQEHR